jgi:hypothetical protein
LVGGAPLRTPLVFKALDILLRHVPFKYAGSQA